VKAILLIILPVFAWALATSEASAVCYCACVTATGGRCTVSVPDYSCHREGRSLCRDPLEHCAYRCDIKLERPVTCNPRRRCSVRQTDWGAIRRNRANPICAPSGVCRRGARWSGPAQGTSMLPV